MDLESEKKKIISAITEKMDRVYRNTKKKKNKNGDYLKNGDSHFNKEKVFKCGKNINYILSCLVQ